MAREFISINKDCHCATFMHIFLRCLGSAECVWKFYQYTQRNESNTVRFRVSKGKERNF